MDSVQSLQSFNSQAPNSLPLLSCPSEPPDVGKWFSSYKYCSPNPDSNIGLEESASRGTESQRDEEQKEVSSSEMVKTQDEEVAVEKPLQRSACFEGDKHNEEACLTKNLDSFSSPSLLSEPPDIRNWFSSYVYESFVPDTCSMYKDDVVSQENECDEESVELKAINEYEDLSKNENVHQKGNVERNSSFDEHDCPSSKGDGSISHLEDILQPCMQDKAMQHNQESSSCSREKQVMSLGFKKGSDYRTAEMVQESNAKIQHDKVVMSTSLSTSFSEKGPTCSRNGESDGFVSTRKDKYPEANDENSWKKPENLSRNTGKVPLASEKQSAVKRKALADATNVVNSNDIVITGKWKCPQKHKPYVGPAMKQLRLEKWVRRV